MPCESIRSSREVAASKAIAGMTMIFGGGAVLNVWSGTTFIPPPTVTGRARRPPCKREKWLAVLGVGLREHFERPGEVEDFGILSDHDGNRDFPPAGTPAPRFPIGLGVLVMFVMIRLAVHSQTQGRRRQARPH